MPNSDSFDPLNTLVGGLLPNTPDPFLTPAPLSSYQSFLLNNPTRRLPFFNYDGGGENESYDAADFQNMFLALQTVTPRAQGRVVRTDGTFIARLTRC